MSVNFSGINNCVKTPIKTTNYTIGGLSQKPILQKNIGQTQISIVKNDLTTENVDAIVNAANQFLSHGAGVAGAICRKGGKIIQKQSDDIIKQKNRIEKGESVTTEAGELPCKKVIHTVGPIWEDGNSNEKEELAQCMKTILREAKINQLKSISIPAISSGIFGFPKDQCAKILLEETQKLLKLEYSKDFEEIRFCNFDNETVDVFAKEFTNQFNKEEPQKTFDQNEKKLEINNENQGLKEDFKEEEEKHNNSIEEDQKKEGHTQEAFEKNEMTNQILKESQNVNSQSQKEGKPENHQQKDISDFQTELNFENPKQKEEPNQQTEKKDQLIEQNEANQNESAKKLAQENNNSTANSYVKQNLEDQAIDSKSQELSENIGQENQIDEEFFNKKTKL